MPAKILLYLIVYGLVSLVAFCAYGIDKYKAQHKRWRIPEAFLLGVGFCGGAIGALAGMKLFRHKTKHWYFWVVNFIGLIWQLGLAAYAALMM
jgi:uncharacterized membrane protein YsdA (DUF1294 family)